jgi:hypothetical protein
MNRFLLAAAVILAVQGAARASDILPTKFESVPPGEAAQIAEQVTLTGKLMELRYGAGAGDTMARRAVHPKAHGCVKAQFIVDPDLPAAYRVGVFATPGKRYPAWIRFSNATAVIAPDVNDKKADSRGMAIKLMGVEGETLLDEPGGKTQDFLLINQPMFAFPDVPEYLAFTRIQLEKKDNAREIFPVFLTPSTPERLKIVGIVTKVIQPTQLANPLDADYFSGSPFLFGPDRAAKFAARPRNPANPSLTPETPAADYLRAALQRSLKGPDARPIVFDFQVQLRPDGLQPFDTDYPIEIANTEWKPKADGAASYKNVATLVIDPQDIDNPLQATECEHLVFTPWHGLKDHQPLGGINRLRRDVYIASAKRRTQTSEPTGFPRWPQ